MTISDYPSRQNTLRLISHSSIYAAQTNEQRKDAFMLLFRVY